MPQLTGKAYIYVNGAEIATDKGASLQVGGVKRAIKGGPRPYGYAEETVYPEVDVKILHLPDTDMLAIPKIVDATVVFECDNGPRYTLRSAFVLEMGAMDADNGTIPVKFGALSCDKS